MKKKTLSIAIQGVLGATLLSGVLPNAVLAQQQERERAVEEVTVTGSRIRRPDLESVSPMTIINSEEFEISGNLNVEQKLAELPSIVPAFGPSSNNPGDGTATVDLRGLGTARTLVLVNGRRYIPSRVDGVVDLNTIPGSLIKQVDVVTGGASAVHGSDALAGVVNFQLIDDFEGVEISSLYDVTTEGDAEKYNMDITVGGNFDDGRGNAVLYAAYAKRESLFQGDRDFSNVALAESGPVGDRTLVPGGSSGIPGTRIFGGPTVSGPNGDFTLGRFDPDGTGQPFGPDDRFNYAPDNFLQLPQERYLISTLAHYDLSDNARIYSELAFSRNLVPQELAPTPAFTTLEINPDSPFFDAATRAALDGERSDTNGDGVIDGDDNAEFFIGRRMVENGPRQSVDKRNAFRALIGIDGNFGGEWGYDAYYSKSILDGVNLLENDVSKSRFKRGVAVTDDGTACQDDPDGDCVPINIFGAGNIDQAAIDYIKVGASNVTSVEQEVLQANVSGPVFKLPGADASAFLVVGFEHRADEADFRPDTFLSTGDILGFNAGDATSGKYSSTDAFLEFDMPIVQGAPGIELLNLWAAYRYSDYSNIGGVDSYASTLTYAPVGALKFRAGYQRAVRAPNVNELFQGQANGFPGATDPCADENTTANVALCEATGVPVGQVGQFAQANDQIEGIFGGNPDLQEETSDTFTIGAVIQPMEGLDLSIDYYNIEIEDAISVLGGGVANTLDLCYNRIADLASPYCQAISRRADGNVDVVVATNANIGLLETSGVDLNLSYTTDLNFGIGGGSELRFNLTGTYLDKYDITPVADLPNDVEECADQFGNICGEPLSKMQWNLRTTWISGDLTLSTLVRFIGAAEDDRLRNRDARYEDFTNPISEEQYYLDVSAAYQFTEEFKVNFGINNILDTEPTPLSGDQAEQANTYPETYPLFGPRVFLSASYKFR